MTTAATEPRSATTTPILETPPKPDPRPALRPGPRLRRLRATLVCLIVLPPALFAGWRYLSGNFGTIIPGEFYRSAQLSPRDLAAALRDFRVKTVVNLRGHNPDAPWYHAEVAETLAAGATQIDIALSSSEWMSREQALALLEVLETCERPVLIHCWRGAERTGMTAAFVQLLQPDSTVERAAAEFGLKYLFLPLGDGKTTIRHFEQYVRWLRDAGREHSPDTFREWVARHYVPGVPGRWQWPHDPYPLTVVTRPGTAARRNDSDPDGTPRANTNTNTNPASPNGTPAP